VGLGTSGAAILTAAVVIVALGPVIEGHLAIEARGRGGTVSGRDGAVVKAAVVAIVALRTDEGIEASRRRFLILFVLPETCLFLTEFGTEFVSSISSAV